MARRPRRKAEETRQDILSMADALFRKDGYSKVAIADIATALDMSPANVFKHFHSKTALADAIAAHHLATTAERFTHLDEDCPPPERLARFLRRLMEAHLADVRDNPYIFEMVVMISKADMPSTHFYKDLMRESVAAIIRAGVTNGDYTCSNPEETALTVLDCTTCMLHPVLLVSAESATLHERCDAVVAFVNRALSSPLPSDD